MKQAHACAGGRGEETACQGVGHRRREGAQAGLHSEGRKEPLCSGQCCQLVSGQRGQQRAQRAQHAAHVSLPLVLPPARVGRNGSKRSANSNGGRQGQTTAAPPHCSPAALSSRGGRPTHPALADELLQVGEAARGDCGCGAASCTACCGASSCGAPAGAAGGATSGLQAAGWSRSLLQGVRTFAARLQLACSSPLAAGPAAAHDCCCGRSGGCCCPRGANRVAAPGRLSCTLRTPREGGCTDGACMPCCCRE